MKRLSLFRHPYFKKRVLEIGGGHDPYVGVTHAVDKYPNDNSQRAGDLLLRPGVEFRQGDIESIPYSSESGFDFVFVSHVFEHVQSPEKAVSEINRVAKAGYIETPTPLREQLHVRGGSAQAGASEDFHLLFCWSHQGSSTLHVLKKSEQSLFRFCSCENGVRTRRLLECTPVPLGELEQLLPRTAKTTRLYFRTPLKLMVHSDFESACRAGHCAYRSVANAYFWASFPLRLYGRFGRLRECLDQVEERARRAI